MRLVQDTTPSRVLDISVSTGGANVLELGVMPLILLPGIMGSRLELWPPGARRALAWDPDSVAKMLRFVLSSSEGFARKIHKGHPGNVMLRGAYGASRAQRGWNGVVKFAYGTMLEALDKLRLGYHHTPVYALGYDWRQDNARTGQELAPRIEAILQKEGAQQFALITHSMGGLCGRSMLQAHPDLAKKARAVIHIAQPAAGAPVMYRRCFYGAPSHLDGWSMRLLLGKGPRRFLTAVSGLDTPFQLLPTSHYRDGESPFWIYERIHKQLRPLTGDVWDLYLQRRSPPGIALAGAAHRCARDLGPRLRRRVVKARAFHDALGLYRHPSTYSVVGLDELVDCSFAFDPQADASQGLGKMGPLHRRKDGDQTVPRTSASALFRLEDPHAVRENVDLDRVRQLGISRASHDEICAHPQCVQAVAQILRWSMRPLAERTRSAPALGCAQLVARHEHARDRAIEGKSRPALGRAPGELPQSYVTRRLMCVSDERPHDRRGV